MATCNFTVVEVTDEIVFLVDDDIGGISVTNAAGVVAATIAQRHPGRRIVYRDSMGRWDEIVHDNGRFRGFAPYKARLQ